QDTFFLIDERTIRSGIQEAVNQIISFSSNCSFVIDSTKDNILYNSYINQIDKLLNSDDDDRTLSQQFAQIASGLELKKIMFSKELVEFRQDLDILAFNRTALEKGEEKLEGSEGYVACLRTMIYFFKGNGEFITYE